MNLGPSWKIWRHKRYVVAIMAFLGFMNIYTLRANLSIAIVDMTQLKNITLDNGTTILKKDFDWDSKLQGYVLSSFFYGYVFTQIAGGYLATKIGGTWVFSFGIASTAFFTLITPWVAKTNVYFFIVVRTIEGLCEGVTFPAVQEIWSQWAPPAEKSRLVSISISGGYFGAVVAMPACSLIASSLGWEYIFYIFGAVGLLWYLIWVILIAASPSKDKRIDPLECKYIVDAISAVKSDEHIEVPWRRILTSPAVIANAVCMISEGWGFYTLLTFLPQMIKSLLDFDLNQVGFLAALPYLVMSLMVQAGGYSADFILQRKYLNTTQVRKLLIMTGFSAQAIFLLLAGYWVSPVGTSVCLVVAVGLGGLAVSGMGVVPIDIAPKFASVIYGIATTVATLPGIISPILTGYLVTDSTNIFQWRIVFYIASGIYLFGIIVCFMFISGVRQSWADKEEVIMKDNHNQSFVSTE
ncbi:sialin-like isoform X1 [Diabrotica virgifera virgifera]|uniref:Major facilitator superfamily (MFS) profile domain-containing protein n=1 Tax=Diabrotica virgifera virgifera TaxID=50390 RepID=A0ABM5JVR4_DIAVI|nr:sialin-like isoform X1 [Diabrotica virgifera virgifera]